MNETSGFVVSNSFYDKAKWGTTILLPASGTLYFALSQIWGWPHGEAILGTIIAVQAFLGVLLGISSRSYANSEDRFDGDINVHEMGDAISYHMALNGDPAELKDKDEVTFKVNKPNRDV